MNVNAGPLKTDRMAWWTNTDGSEGICGFDADGGIYKIWGKILL
jgi:hypothetical protein